MSVTVDGHLIDGIGDPGPPGPKGDPGIPTSLSIAANLLLELVDSKLDLDVQAANTVVAGPVSGAAAKPTARGLAWQDAGTVPACRLESNYAVNADTDAWTLMTFDVEKYDTHGFHEDVTYPGRLTIPAGMDGLYLVFAEVVWEAHADDMVRIGGIFLNDDPASLSYQFASAADTQPSSNVLAVPLKLVAGDFLELWGRQRSGVMLTMVCGNPGCKFGLFRLGL